VDSIFTIDCHYAGIDQVVCAYLIVDKGRATFIETNTSHAVPHLLAKLDSLGIPRENVDFVIITHVHLDHAGGSSALLSSCPNAKLLAHPKAAKHMMNPTRLIESSKQVYGEETFQKLYGEISPIPEHRIRIMLDGESLEWGSRNFNFIYTKGHANHHFCVYDSLSNAIFTGDSFGIAYPKMENGGRFIFPTTTPTDFNYEEAIRSLDLVLGTGANIAYLTHFGSVDNLKEKAQHLKEGLLLCNQTIEQAKDLFQKNEANDDPNSKLFEKEKISYFENKVTRMISTLALHQNVELTEKDWEILGLDVDLNSQGLLYAFNKKQ
jgi:glyoxylase-like metal-dependent hydrolase (beta-lactamase superfamily II)